MATVKKSIRIEQETADRVSALKQGQESEAAAYNRVICAGLEAIERGPEEAEAADSEAPAQATDQAERIADLKATIDSLHKQLEAKDKQIERTQELVAQAHSLHKAEQEKITALALPEPKKSLGQRIKEFFTGAEKPQQSE